MESLRWRIRNIHTFIACEKYHRLLSLIASAQWLHTFLCLNFVIRRIGKMVLSLFAKHIEICGRKGLHNPKTSFIVRQVIIGTHNSGCYSCAIFPVLLEWTFCQPPSGSDVWVSLRLWLGVASPRLVTPPCLPWDLAGAEIKRLSAKWVLKMGGVYLQIPGIHLKSVPRLFPPPPSARPQLQPVALNCCHPGLGGTFWAAECTPAPGSRQHLLRQTWWGRGCAAGLPWGLSSPCFFLPAWR